MKPSKSFPFPISLLLIIGIVAISFSSIFIRWSNSPVSVSAMYRLTITALLMLPLLFPYRASVRRMRLREWLELFASGLALGLHFLLWMGSLRLTSVASSTAITSLEPVFVLLGAWLLYRQKTSWPAILSMGLAMLGALMIGWGDWGLTGSALLGDALSLLGTAAVAAHMLLGKRLLATCRLSYTASSSSCLPPFV